MISYAVVRVQIYGLVAQKTPLFAAEYLEKPVIEF